MTPALPLVWNIAEKNFVVELLQAFSTPWFLFSNATNHHLVFFLLEIFNNIIQYQFDGEALVHVVIKAWSEITMPIKKKQAVYRCM